jgi:Na+-driven multidrug efflux pump
MNNLIYGVALASLTAIMGHLSSDMVSANAIAANLRDLTTVACMALGTAGSILLGQEMGAGRMDAAKSLGKTLLWLSLIMGAAAGALLMLVRTPVIALSGLTGEAAGLLSMMLPINALYCIGRSFNSCLISGIFCAGGDTRFGVFLDLITMWVIVLPLSYLAAFVLDCRPIVIYAFLNLDEFVKMIPSAWRFSRYRWLRNLTRA